MLVTFMMKRFQNMKESFLMMNKRKRLKGQKNKRKTKKGDMSQREKILVKNLRKEKLEKQRK